MDKKRRFNCRFTTWPHANFVMTGNVHLQAFLYALSFLTTIPVPSNWFSEEGKVSAWDLSPVYYPLVGLVVGVVLFGVSVGADATESTYVVAALVLSIWVVITGGLHMDGLADSFDASYAAHKGKSDLKGVFKDPHIGSVGVIAICLCLLVKFSIIHAIVNHENASNLVLLGIFVFTCWVSRLVATIIMYSKKYVSENGIASDIDLKTYKTLIVALSICTVAFAALVLGPVQTVLALSVLTLAAYCWIRKWKKLIGGYNGDCLGALIEISEVLCLFILLITMR